MTRSLWRCWPQCRLSTHLRFVASQRTFLSVRESNRSIR